VGTGGGGFHHLTPQLPPPCWLPLSLSSAPCGRPRAPLRSQLCSLVGWSAPCRPAPFSSELWDREICAVHPSCALVGTEQWAPFLLGLVAPPLLLAGSGLKDPAFPPRLGQRSSLGWFLEIAGRGGCSTTRRRRSGSSGWFRGVRGVV
jgi:hypothetical protein